MAESTPRPYTIGDLLRVMARLRDPESGCPWDREQNFATIAPYTIEEAYEVADAIARNDLDALKDELGDLLLQVVYHARMAEEDGRFAFADVVDAITAKMIRRHPHVFEDTGLRDAFLASGTWERIKAEEKAERSGRDEAGSVLDDVPVALPALTRAVKLQSRAARVGFDWPSLAPVLAKIEEEIAELKSAIADEKRGKREAGAPARRKSPRSSAIFSSSWRMSRGISGSIPRPRCATPTPNSCAGFAASRQRFAPRAAGLRTRRWKRWTSSGTKQRLPSRNSPLGTPRMAAIISRSRWPCPRASPDAAAKRCRYRWCPR